MPILTFELERGDDLIELELDYEVAPIDPGCGPSWNHAGDPPSGGEIEDLTVTRDGAAIDLTPDEQALVEEFIYDKHDYSDDGDYGEDW